MYIFIIYFKLILILYFLIILIKVNIIKYNLKSIYFKLILILYFLTILIKVIYFHTFLSNYFLFNFKFN